VLLCISSKVSFNRSLILLNHFRRLTLLLGCLYVFIVTEAAPRLPNSDAEVLEHLPTRAQDPLQREIRAVRLALAADPQNLTLALQLARRYYAEVTAEGDPRYIGYAQASLAPWWSLPDPPVAVRLMRAVLLQFNHHFEPALADLKIVVAAEPNNSEAWAWLAAIAMVRADYVLARSACKRFAPLTVPAVAVGCLAHVDAASGNAASAVSALRTALKIDKKADARQRLWALTRLAETEERLGRDPAAEAAYREALALKITDSYLLAAYADFLLDQGRASEVLTLLQGKQRSDVLLLRLALAAKAVGSSALIDWQRDLGARFNAAKLRGDAVHQKEESRFALHLLGDAALALTLAKQNYAVQREPADARILLEAAIAAKQPAAAEPVLAWMRNSGIESKTLKELARQLGNLS
jgi:tetratricopeptide (TPR) repeat protein